MIRESRLSVDSGRLSPITKYLFSGITPLGHCSMSQTSLNKKLYVSIDDFGVGNSSISMLMENNIKTVKIDRQFIIDETESGRKLLNNIIKLIKELGFEMVAEGVETLEQQEYLKSRGCNIIQGYYFSKPLSFDEYKTILKDGGI